MTDQGDRKPQGKACCFVSVYRSVSVCVCACGALCARVLVNVLLRLSPIVSLVVCCLSFVAFLFGLGGGGRERERERERERCFCLVWGEREVLLCYFHNVVMRQKGQDINGPDIFR